MKLVYFKYDFTDDNVWTEKVIIDGAVKTACLYS